MSENNNEKMLGLLADKAIFGLNEDELKELRQLEALYPEMRNDSSFELTAAAFNLTAFESFEPMPDHLRARVMADADDYFGLAGTPATDPAPKKEEYQKTFEFEPKKTSIWQWLGWPVAAAACAALALNIWMSAGRDQNIAQVPPPAPTITQKREKLLAENRDVVTVAWAEPDPKKAVGIAGDVVWSNSKQEGYMRFRGLPKNDATKEQYQLWIFDAEQSDKTPPDGGVFDINEDGEVIVPIDAKIKIAKPVMFAVTAEKPGGVVVSDRKKLLTIGKIQT